MVLLLNCLWNCSKATQQPEFRCDMATNCACYLLHLWSHFLQADEHISRMLKRMEWIRNEVYKLLGWRRFRCLLARWHFLILFSDRFWVESVLCHTVTNNIFEFLTLMWCYLLTLSRSQAVAQEGLRRRNDLLSVYSANKGRPWSLERGSHAE